MWKVILGIPLFSSWPPSGQEHSLSSGPLKIYCNLSRVWWRQEWMDWISLGSSLWSSRDQQEVRKAAVGGEPWVLSSPRWQEHTAGNICRPEALRLGGNGGQSQMQAFPQEMSKIPEGSVQVSFHALGLCLNVTSPWELSDGPTPPRSTRAAELPSCRVLCSPCSPCCSGLTCDRVRHWTLSY